MPNTIAGTSNTAPEIEDCEAGSLAQNAEMLDSVKPASIAPEQARVVSNVETLPNELLCNILGFLDTPKPSASRLYDEPTFKVTDTEIADLKAASRVSKRWRRATIPMLFKHTRFIAADSQTHRPILNKQILPFLDFVQRNELRKVITSFTLLVHDKKIASDSDGEYRLSHFSNFWYSLFEIVDPVELLLVAPSAALGALTSCHVMLEDAWNFDCPCHYLRLQRSSASMHGPPSAVEGVQIEKHPTDSQIRDITEPIIENFSVDDIPELTDPTRDDSGGSTLAEGSSESPNSSSTYVSFEPWEYPRARASAVFDVRPWTSLLLNEGSFIRAYATYEYWQRQTPSILHDLVGADDPSHKPFISPTIRDMSYIGIFPISQHIQPFTRNLPRLDRLYMQIVPRNNILEIPEKMRQVEQEDLWMERNSCYALIMRELFNASPTKNYKYLREFESGDAADRDAWEMAVEYVKRSGRGWKIAGDGVFVRDARDVEPENPDGGEGGSDTGNKVSRRSQIIGTTNIILGGKTVIQAEVIIRGDLLRTLSSTNSDKSSGNPVAVAIGREGERDQKVLMMKRAFSHYPLKIADHVFVGPGSIIEAALIGTHVSVGSNCVIGKFAIIKDYVKILDGTVVPPNMVIPSFSVVGGRPGRVVGEVAEGEVDGFDLREMYRGIGNS
ncbi:hypothetical protein G7Y89_g5240 [Cudoniella acicularis]|uniref:Dynactin subunit 5 n=1 Tax=Cudoniella acicularis TaxID=354080 RepID=A0A8H4RMV7_9HELO|nr:hypothetical protein G7Y89_g5240 [Cudoniella acicularis]